MKILLFLELRQLANYIRVTLRSPKRLIPVILMMLWFAMMFLPQIMVRTLVHRPPAFPIAIQFPEIIPSVLFFVCSIIMVYMVLKSFSDSLLVFGLSDIDFLFPTPISRRAIMTLKLLGLYMRAGSYALFMAMVFVPQLSMLARSMKGSVSTAWLGGVLFAAVIINICTLINLIATFREGKKWWLAWVVRGIAYALLIFAAGSIFLVYQRTGNVADGIVQTLRHPVITTLLLPSKWAADLLLTAFTGLVPGIGRELAMMALLAAGSYALVMMRDENPYEPALAASTRAAAIRAAARAGGYARMRTEMWKTERRKTAKAEAGVPPFGRGAGALVWKNLNVGVRSSGRAMVTIPAIAAVALIATRATLPSRDVEDVIEILVPVVLGYFVFFTSMLTLQSFRSDLKQANILKPMPFPSWQIIAAQSVHGTLMVSGFTWILVVLVAVTYGLRPNSILPVLALTLPFLSYDLLCWQSAAAIIYPKVEDPTQQYLGSLIGMLASGIAVVPPMAVGAIAWFLHAGLIVVTVLAATISIGMAVIGIAVSGHLYSKFDPSDE